MDIRVSGHQITTGAALQGHAEERMTGIVEKHFARALSSHVTLGKAPQGAFRCDIVTHVMQGLILKGSGIAQDAHQALDQAAARSRPSCAATSAASRTITASRRPPSARKRRPIPCSTRQRMPMKPATPRW